MRLKILIVLTFVLLACGCGQKATDAERNAEQFIRYLAAQDMQNAKTLAAGSVLYNLSKDQDVPAAEITEIKVQTLAESANWAELHVATKLILAGGDTDITWYKLNMYNDGTWKVYQAELTGPNVTGASNTTPEDMEVFKTVFADYMKALATDTQKSIKYLAGPARRAQEMAMDTLGNAPLVKEIGDLTITPLWYNNDILVCRMDYTLSGRDVKVVVIFAKCDTWKIAKVTAL